MQGKSVYYIFSAASVKGLPQGRFSNPPADPELRCVFYVIAKRNAVPTWQSPGITHPVFAAWGRFENPPSQAEIHSANKKCTAEAVHFL